MNKIYTLQKKQLREDSDSRTILDFFLIDEKGNQRVVSGVAKLGNKDQIKSVKAIYLREAPLMNALLKIREYQKVEVSYPKNDKKPRVTIVPADIELSSSMMLQSSNNDFLQEHEPDSLKPSFFSLAVLAVLAYCLWLASKYAGI